MATWLPSSRCLRPADFLVDHGATKSYSLDVAAKLIGMPGKLDCQGADVQAMIDAGAIEDVRAYCMQDVAQTIALFLRTQLIRGAIYGTAYEAAVRVLLAAITAEPRLAPLLPLIDRERLARHARPGGGDRDDAGDRAAEVAEPRTGEP